LTERGSSTDEEVDREPTRKSRKGRPRSQLTRYLALLLSGLIVPLVLCLFLATYAFHDYLSWIVTTVACLAYVAFLVIAFPWFYLNYYLRLIVPLLLLVAFIVSLVRLDAGSFFPNGVSIALVLGILLALWFWGVIRQLLRGYRGPADALDVAFPLGGSKDGAVGRYVVAHGGSSKGINYHASHPEQRYACDLLKLRRGFRARGLFPRQLDRYAIYGDTVASPCDGTVVEAVDGLPDLMPPLADREHPAGNYVRIAVGDVTIVLAHLQPGSLLITEGQSVKAGRPIGRAGNSGNTSEPHLHIHAERDGAGIPLRFDGRYLHRNDVIR